MSEQIACNLASACFGFLAAIYFCFGSAFLSQRKTIALARTCWDFNKDFATATVSQSAQYAIGSLLLVVSFLLQVVATQASPTNQLALYPVLLLVPVFVLAILVPVGLVSFGVYHCLVNSALASTPEKLVEKLLVALRPVPDFKRQENAGAVIREFKAEGLIPFRPQRIDYTDYYLLLQPLPAFGQDLILIEEEYMLKFVGCCVSEGAGLVLRIVGDLRPLEEFAKANQCRVEEYKSEAQLKEFTHIRFSVPLGRYAALSCRVRDETQ